MRCVWCRTQLFWHVCAIAARWLVYCIISSRALKHVKPWSSNACAFQRLVGDVDAPCGWLGICEGWMGAVRDWEMYMVYCRYGVGEL
jgi:hypothetical protein